MKKFILFLGAAALLVSCSNKLEQELQSLIGTEQIIYASLPGTKTTTNGTSTSWSDQDQMTVFYTNSDNGFGASCFTYTQGESFSGKVKNLNKTTNDWYSLYPYDESNTNVKAAILTVPATQTQDGNGNMSHIAGANDPLWGSSLNVAYGTKPSMQMHHVLAIAKFTVTNTESAPIKVSSIEFSSPFPMTGTFSADMTEQNFTWGARSYSRKVTLNVSNAQEIQPGNSADFYASFLPGSANGEYTVKVNATKGGETISSTKTTTINLSFANGVVEGLNYSFVADGGGSEQGGEQGEEGKYYVKITSEPQSWDGTYLFVDETSGKAFAAFTSEAGNKYATSVTINNGKIEATSGLAKYALTVTDAGKKHANDNVSSLEAYNVRNSDGQYIYWSSNFGEYDNAILINDNDNKATNSSTDYYYYHTFKYSNGVQVTSAISTGSGSAYYLGYSNGFAYGKSESSNRIQLYKLDGEGGESGSSKTDQSLSFSNSTVTWTIGNGYTVGNSYDIQSVSGAKTTVTYSSSNTSVATVSGSKVTIKGTGTTTITANAASSDTYNAGSATYTLRISDGASTEKAYIKVTSAPADWSGTYLIVDESAGKAFNENASSYASSVTINDHTVLWSETVAKYEVTISHSSVSGMYELKTVAGKYMYSYYDGETTLNSSNKQSSNTYYNSLSISSGNVTMYSTRNGSSGASVNYFGYVSSTSDNPNGKNFGYKEDATTRTVQLYKLEGTGDSDPEQGGEEQVDPSGKTYTKVSSFTSGKAYVIVYDNNALKNNNGSTTAYSTSSKVSGNTIVIPNSDVASVEWIATKQNTYSTGDFYLTNGGKFLFRDEDNNLTAINSSDTDFDYHTAWSISSSGLYNMSNNTSSTKNYARYSSNQWSTSTSSKTITIYEATPSTSAPTMPGEQGEQGGQEQVDPSGKTYTKVSSFSSGKAYVIVASSNALKNNSGSTTAYSVSGKVSGNNVVIPNSDVASVEWIATKQTTYSNGEFYLTNGGKFLFRDEDNNLSLINSTAAEFDFHAAWSISSSGLYNVNSQGSNAYARYSSSKWSTSTTASSITIYEATPSTTAPEMPSGQEGQGEQGGQSGDPTQDGTVFNLENSKVQQYLAAAESQYKNSNTTSIVSTYSSSNSSSNRLDTPEPVTISWTGSATSISIYEGTTTSTTPFKTQTFSSATSVKIYNLIPGKTYTYKVNNSSSTTGTFSTTGRRRMIKVSSNASSSHATNCRDLGGVLTINNEKLNYGLIYRGTNMDSITSDEKKVLTDELGIKLDVDLRASGERKSTSPIGVAITSEGYQSSVSDLTTTNKIKSTLTSIMTYVVEGKPVYIHCRIGSDRTGFVCMLVEALLGASLKECDMDYELTSFASSIVGGNRKRNEMLNADFRKFFGTEHSFNKSASYSVETVPEAVEDYVLNTLEIDKTLVQNFRKAMGVSAALK